MSDIIWGPEISVNAVRPAWLADGEQFEFWSELRKEWSDVGPYFWSNRKNDASVLIRLPADHPHYQPADPADTVTVPRLSLADLSEAREAYFASVSLASDDSALFYARRWGLLREETTAERFTRETGHEATKAVLDALAFERNTEVK